MQLELERDIQELLPARIEFNYDELKRYFAANLEKYKGLVVMEDRLPDAKKTRADLRRIRENIDTWRKEIKKEWMKPFEGFESKCKELMALCDEPINEIDVQVKAFEQSEKQEKENRLHEYFNSIAESVSDYIGWSDIFNVKWLNTTFSEQEAQKDIQSAVKRCEDDIKLIKALKADAAMESMMLDVYKRDKNVAVVMAMYNRVKEETERKKAEEAKKAEPQKEEKKPPVARQEEPASDEEEEELPEPIELRFYMTAEQRRGLGLWCRENGVRYERI